MRRTLSLLTLPALALAPLLVAGGCMPAGGVNAPYGSSVSVSPGTLTVSNGSSVWEQDNIGLIEFAEVLVTDSDGYPMENIKVEVKGPSEGVFFIPQQAIEAVDYPSAPEDFKAQRESTCYDEAGNFDNTEDWCAWYYDGVTGNYYDLGQSYTQGDGDGSYAFQPNYTTFTTDGRGYHKFWFFVDAMPVEMDTESSGGGTGDTGDTGGASTSTDVTYNISGEHTLYITIGVDSTTLAVTSDG